MRVTVIPLDKTIICDGTAIRIKPWPFDDGNIHAIQWYDTNGEIEFVGIPRPANEVIDDSAVVQPYIDAFNQAQLEQDQPS